MAATQSSQLLPSLFTQYDPEQRLTVLHIGPPLPETLEFFSRFRCRLYFVDVLGELPVVEDEDVETSLQEQLLELLALPEGTRVDVCLFWDVFNYLDAKTIGAFLSALQPYLHEGTRAHAFAVHKLNSAESSQRYGITDTDVISMRSRPSPLSGYAPHAQGKLRDLLNCFIFDRSVLLSGSRLELLLKPSALTSG